jgi:hypothetical protein
MKTLKSLAIMVCFGALMFSSNIKAAGLDRNTSTVLIAQHQAPAAPQTDTQSTTDQQSTSQSTDANSANSTSQQSTDQSNQSGSQLPQTASDLPLVAAIGLLSLGVAASLRHFLKNVA